MGVARTWESKEGAGFVERDGWENRLAVCWLCVVKVCIVVGEDWLHIISEAVARDSLFSLVYVQVRNNLQMTDQEPESLHRAARTLCRPYRGSFGILCTSSPEEVQRPLGHRGTDIHVCSAWRLEQMRCWGCGVDVRSGGAEPVRPAAVSRLLCRLHSRAALVVSVGRLWRVEMRRARMSSWEYGGCIDRVARAAKGLLSYCEEG
jgi:hypothetical protein